MKNISVFCAASRKLENRYYEEALAFGEWMGKHNKVLIYGGANSGLMEAVAKGVKQQGGKVVGVIPHMLESKCRVSSYVDEAINCKNLSERKDIMMEQSDVFVALPGGIGTLDEIFTVMASNSIGYHAKKVILFNVSGFWDGLLGVLNEMDSKHFINVPLSQYLEVVRSWDELDRLLG